MSQAFISIICPMHTHVFYTSFARENDIPYSLSDMLIVDVQSNFNGSLS